MEWISEKITYEGPDDVSVEERTNLYIFWDILILVLLLLGFTITLIYWYFLK